MAIQVDHHACIVCGSCIPACPTNCLSIGDGAEPRLVVDEPLCAECSACIPVCPVEALAFPSDEVEAKHKKQGIPDLDKPYEPPKRSPPRPATQPDPIDPEQERFDPLSWRPGGGSFRRAIKRKLRGA
jgi:NAD-dependent dihydropyrimidine dehydrogenase PreA subunit